MREGAHVILMASRGKKPKTAKNSTPRLLPTDFRMEIHPASPLVDKQLAEFRRLVDVLFARGTLDLVDVAVITEAARVCARLSKAYDDDDTKVINQLTTQRRGLLRELGLTLQPSRSLVKTVAKDQNEADPIAGKIKLHG